MRGAVAGEQRFGLPEVGLAVISLITWAFGKYISAYISERGKQRATLQPKPETEKRLENLELSIRHVQERIELLLELPSLTPSEFLHSRPDTVGETKERPSQAIPLELDELELLLRSILEDIRMDPSRPLVIVSDHSDLIGLLERMGLTKRAAEKASPRIVTVVITDLPDLFREG